MARTTARRIHRQTGQGHYSGGSRSTVGAPEVYGNDRIFAYVRLEFSAPTRAQEAKVAALEKAGQPVVRIALCRHLRSRPGIFPLGDCYGGCGFDHRHQRLQSARRGSQQNRHCSLTSEYEKQVRCPLSLRFLRKEESNSSPTKGMPTTWPKPQAANRSLPDYLRAHLDAARSRRLFCSAGLYRDESEHEALLQELRIMRARQKARRDLPWLWAALSALHGTSLQRRSEQRSVSANHLRRR